MRGFFCNNTHLPRKEKTLLHTIQGHGEDGPSCHTFLLQLICPSEVLFSVSVLAHTLKSWLQKQNKTKKYLTRASILIAKEKKTLH